MQLDQAIEYFLTAKRAEGRRPDTIATYGRALYRFATDMPSIEEVEDISVPSVRGYIAKLQARQDSGQWSDTSVALHVRHLKVFTRWCKNEELLRSDPFAGGKDARVKVPKAEERHPDTMTDEEFKGLLATCNTKTDLGRRDAALLMFLLDTGVRVGELCDLLVSDVNIPQRIAHLRKTKGRRERDVFFSPETALALTRYLARRPRQTQWLFMANRRSSNGQLATNGVRLRIRALAKKAGINPSRVHPHVFRHTMATNYLRMGGDPAHLQREVGHRDISTTMKYVHLVTEDLQRSHDEHSSMHRLAAR